MKTELTHITKVKITKLWGEDLNFEWNLNPDVNVLAGDNGSGKTTILNLIAGLLTGADNFPKEVDKLVYSISIEFNNSSIVSMERIRGSIENLEKQADHDELLKKLLSNLREIEGRNYHNLKEKEVDISYPAVNGKPVKAGSEELKVIRLDHVSTFDQPLLPIELLRKRTTEGETYLDFLIERLEKNYLNYQVDIGRRALEALSVDGAEKVHAIRQRIDSKKNLFLDFMDGLFSHTEKRIDRYVNGISFLKSPKQVISPYHLSSGEKQLLIILLTALVQDNQPAVMIMDEPELSLHTDWQEKLIDHIRSLNENAQVIIATHSPFMVSKGWASEKYVFQMDKIKSR